MHLFIPQILQLSAFLRGASFHSRWQRTERLWESICQAEADYGMLLNMEDRLYTLLPDKVQGTFGNQEREMLRVRVQED